MSAQPHMAYMCCRSLHLRVEAAFGSLFSGFLMRCHTLIRFHAIWGSGVSIMPSRQRHSAVVFFLHANDASRYIDSDDTSNPRPSLCREGINVRNMWQNQLSFPLSVTLSTTPTTPQDSGSILLFRSLEAAEKVGQM